MPKYVPVVVALMLAAGPVAATLSPAPPTLQIGPEAEEGARMAPAAPSIGPLAEPHGARMPALPPDLRVGPQAEPHG